MAVTKDGLRAGLAAAWKLDPINPGGGAEPFMSAMGALLPDAEALGDPEMLFRVRLGYAFSLHFKGWKKHSGEVMGERLGVLRACVLMWHAEPHHHRESDVRAMWSQIYNVVDWYVRFDVEPAERVHRLLDELERYCPPTRRWTRFALDNARMKLAARGGDIAEVERLWRLLDAQGPPEEHLYPDGFACAVATMWERLGYPDRAAAALAPVAAGQIRMATKNVWEADLIMPYLRLGRVEEAVALHERTYRHPDLKLEGVAAHLEFCARTGNVERGMDVLRRNVLRLGSNCNYVEEMWTAAAAALLCGRVCELGLDREWYWPCLCDDPGCERQVLMSHAKLGGTLHWGAIGLARRIDRMDGVSHLAERIEALVLAEPLADGVELPRGDGPSARPAAPPLAPHLDAADADGLRRELGLARPLEFRDRIARTQRVVQNAVAGGETDVLVEARFMLLDDMLAERCETWRAQLFTLLDELFRLHGERPGLLSADRVGVLWAALPVTMDRVLARSGPHLRQIRDLLDRAEACRRPGTDDLHHVRWYRAEAAARAGDADALRAAWEEFRELPEAGRYAGREFVLRRVKWLADLGCDEEALGELDEGDEREDLLLMPYLRAGLVEKAREVHERTYRTAGRDPGGHRAVGVLRGDGRAGARGADRPAGPRPVHPPGRRRLPLRPAARVRGGAAGERRARGGRARRTGDPARRRGLPRGGRLVVRPDGRRDPQVPRPARTAVGRAPRHVRPHPCRAGTRGRLTAERPENAVMAGRAGQ
ncbi:hypothetical protein BJF79_42815 [Actinomadura sp. CNU-125]|uniref:hypothetical protein n=1 Tax=Actinomadura sp. CNU-125 TaxID=1904961 RepID=UPI000964E1FB|nr:hypothetical protein [Actinomadura sp. CNU-125]OLT27102.1 hypothetical protein BJF79_42815 [Actinomadura sp. CNU-125]